MNIRRAKSEDFKTLAPPMNQFATTLEDGLEARFHWILERSDQIVLVAEINVELVGYAAAQGYGDFVLAKRACV
jgi:hypothetical protein